MKTNVYLEDILINDPINLKGLEVELVFEPDDEDEGAVNIDELVLGVGNQNVSNDGAILANNHLDGGLTGGVGAMEGQPLRIELDDEKSQVFVLFDGYIDLSRGAFLCDRVTAPATEQGQIDWFNKVADKVTFETLFEDGEILESDFLPIPYVINKKIENIEILLSIVSVFVITTEIGNQVNEIAQKIAEIASVISAIGAVLALIVKILYIIVLIIALVRLIIDLYNMLVQPVKYHMGMYVQDSLRIGLAHFNLQFSSSIFQSTPFDNLAIMPEKYNLKEDNTGLLENIIGFFNPNPNEQVGFYKGTVGELIRQMKTVFHLKASIVGDVLHLEKQDFFATTGTYQLPPVDLSNSPFTLNRDDFTANYLLRFSPDFDDRNTVQESQGSSVQIQTTAITVKNPKMNTLDGLVTEQFSFALGKRKTELNKIEKLLDKFFKVIGLLVDAFIFVINAAIDVINSVIGVINDIIDVLDFIGIDIDFQLPLIPSVQSPNIGNLIEDRIDMLKMETDFVNIPKLMLIERSSTPRNHKLSPGNEDFLNALFLWNNFHFFKSFVAQNGWPGNQWKIFNVEKIPFCFDDYAQVRTTNKLIDQFGNTGKWIRLKFNPFDQTATGSFKIQERWTNNLQQIIIEPKFT